MTTRLKHRKRPFLWKYNVYTHGRSLLSAIFKMLCAHCFLDFHLILLSAVFVFLLFFFVRVFMQKKNTNSVNAFVHDWTQIFPLSSMFYFYFFQNRCLTSLPKSASLWSWIGPFHLESITTDLEKLVSFRSTLASCVRSSAVFCGVWR